MVKICPCSYSYTSLLGGILLGCENWYFNPSATPTKHPILAEPFLVVVKQTPITSCNPSKKAILE